MDASMCATVRNAEFECVISQPYEAGRSAFSYQGFCAVCNEDTVYTVDWHYAFDGSAQETRPALSRPCWRERISCGKCGENSRYRALIHMAQTHLKRQNLVHLAEYGSGSFRQLAKRFPLIIGSEYFADGTKPGEYNKDFIRFEDLTRLSFPDGSLDACISSEVFEHIPNYRAAITELCRVLKPGGKALLTTPFWATRAATTIRATVNEDATITHRLPPEYHGSRAGEVLCFQHFGWDLLDDFRAHGFADAMVFLFWNPAMGHMGAWDVGLDGVIMATKGH